MSDNIKILSDDEKYALIEKYVVWEKDDTDRVKLIIPNLAELIYNEFNYNFIPISSGAIC